MKNKAIQPVTQSKRLVKKKIFTVFIIVVVVISLVVLIIPAQFSLPVAGMSKQDYNQNSFWEPWGDHMHAGVDIFGKIGIEIMSASNGIVILAGSNTLGGNFVTILDVDLRFHYYAHLKELDTYIGDIVSAGDKIGTLGNTGSAKNTPPHLHYGIYCFIPNSFELPSHFNEDLLKPFCINPIPLLNEEYSN